MGLDLVPSGRQVPHDVNVVIEIPLNSEPVKYEVDKESGAIFVDRVLTTPMRYPCNYGYIPHTLSGDGDPADVMVMMPLPVVPGAVIRVRAVGMLKMALEQLTAKNVDELDDERRAAMVYNLMVVLCGERDTQPVVNAGTLYQ
jgi:inorganic pyrophosphatase